MQIKKLKQFIENKWCAFAALLLSVFVPSSLMAQNQGPFTVNEGDMSKTQIIDYLFGPISGAGGESALSPLIEQFNYVILILGGIYVAYTLIKGTVDSAHDGQILGKKWSQAWLPVRTAVFTAAIFPVLPGGFAAIQWIVLWLAMQGVGIANVLWSSFAASPLNASSFQTSAQVEPIREAYRSLLLSNICMEAMNKFSRTGDGTNVGGANEWVIKKADIEVSFWGRTSFVIKFEANPVVMPSISASPICGRVSVQDNSSPDGEAAAVSSTGAELLKLDGLEKVMFPIHRNRLMEGQRELNALAKSMVADLSSVSEKQILDTLNNLAMRHGEELKVEAFDYLRDSGIDSTFVEGMKRDGWLMAGAYYMSIAAAQDRITKAVSNAPGSSAPPDMHLNEPGERQGLLSRFWTSISGGNPIGEGARTVIQESYDKINMSVRGGMSGVNAISDAQSEEDGGTWTKMLTGWFINADNFNSDTRANKMLDNPILSARGIGEGMVRTAWSSLLAGLVATAASGPKFPALGAMLAPIFFMIFSTLIVTGSVLMVYLPMVPFILWIGVVFGWVVLLVEAIIAAPLWAVVHLAPDGDDVVGKGGQGYMLVLSLTLRPALMIFGLVAAIILMKPLGFIINSTFASVFDMSMRSAGGTGLTTMVAGMVIYAVFMVQIVHRVFSLIHHIPDNLLKWISISGGELGQDARDVNQGVSGSTVAGLGAMQQMQSAGQSAVGAFNSNKQNSASREVGQHNQAASMASDDSQQAGEQANKADQKASDAKLAGDSAGEASALKEGVSASKQRISSAGSAMLNSARASERSPESSDKERAAAKNFIAGYANASKGGEEQERAFVTDQSKQFKSMGATDRPAFAKQIGSVLAADKQIKDSSVRLQELSAWQQHSPTDNNNQTRYED